MDKEPFPFRSLRRRGWILIAALLTFAAFLSTLQWHVNGSPSPYVTDVGEIQNALPRWGTLHFTGYPLYTFLGSLFVTCMRWLGIQPAAGSSLYSALWGVMTVVLFALLGMELGIPDYVASLSGVAMALTTSFWIDASLAEVHTMSMALTFVTLLFAVRFGRTGRRRDLLLLVLSFSQGVTHQRALVFLTPGILILVFDRLEVLWRNIGMVFAMALTGPLTYLYLPLRAWQGAEWTFGRPGTWTGFWRMIADTKASRIIELPQTPVEWVARVQTLVQLLDRDLPMLLIAFGFLGLALLFSHHRKAGAALLAVMGAYLFLCLIIWEGRVSDALLAAQLPVVALATLGLSVIVGEIGGRWPRLCLVIFVLMMAGCLVLFVVHRPKVVAITHDRSVEEVVARVEDIPPSLNPTTLMALWGHDYWALAYAQTYRGQFPHLDLVDHNANFKDLVARGDRLLTLQKTFYEKPPDWWEERLGSLALTSVAPGIVEIAPEPPLTMADVPEGPRLDLGNGIRILSALAKVEDQRVEVTIYWQEVEPTQEYSVAVHLIKSDPPRDANDIIAQADVQHPVGGWYPTSHWRTKEIVRDDYVLSLPADSGAVGVRVGMYRVDDEGQFSNTEWLFLPLPRNDRGWRGFFI
ncbi:MAG: protein O-mannosyl-transferase family [Anaerolineales bacterium]